MKHRVFCWLFSGGALALAGCTNANVRAAPSLLWSRYLLTLCPLVLLLAIVVLTAPQMLLLLAEKPTPLRRGLALFSGVANALLGALGLYVVIAPTLEGHLSALLALPFALFWLVPLLLGGVTLFRAIKPKAEAPTS